MHVRKHHPHQGRCDVSLMRCAGPGGCAWRQQCQQGPILPRWNDRHRQDVCIIKSVHKRLARRLSVLWTSIKPQLRAFLSLHADGISVMISNLNLADYSGLIYGARQDACSRRSCISVPSFRPNLQYAMSLQRLLRKLCCKSNHDHKYMIQRTTSAAMHPNMTPPVLQRGGTNRC